MVWPPLCRYGIDGSSSASVSPCVPLSGTQRTAIIALIAVFAYAPDAWTQPLPTGRPGKSFVLVIGISEYQQGGMPWLQFADQDAVWFDTRLRKRPSGTNWLFLEPLKNKNATKEHIAAKLRDLSVGASPDASVYILISAAGFADANAKEEVARNGYILAYGSTKELQRTLYTITELKKSLQKCFARVVVFADLSRELQPSGPAYLYANQSDNQINTRLLDVLKQEGKNGILASRERQASKEDPQLQHGIFSYYLVEGLEKTKTFVALIDYVRPLVRNRALLIGARRGQELLPFIHDPSLPLWENTSALDSSFPIKPNWWGSLIRPAFFQRSYPDEQRSSPWEQFMGLDSEHALEFAQHIKQISSSASFGDLNDLSAALEGRGQEILSRYLLGDRFPGDPLKPTPKDFNMAATFLDAALELRPKSKGDDDERATRKLQALRQFSLGRSLIYESLYQQEAVSHLQTAIKIDPELAEPHNALGLLYLEQAKGNDRTLRQAAEEFQSALALEPNWAYPRHNLALTWIEMGQYTAAEKAYRDAIAHTPYYAYLYCNLGLLLHRINRLNAAARAYEDSLSVFKAQIAETGERTARLEAEGQYADSAYLHTRVELLRRYEAEAHNALGALRLSQGKHDQAIVEYQAALSLNHDLLAAQHNLGVLLLNRYLSKPEWRRNETMLDLAIQALSANVNRKDPYLRSREKLADAYMLRRKYKEAELQYRAVVLQEKDNTRALAGWARALANQTHTDEALKLLQLHTQHRSNSENPMAEFTLHKAMGEVYDLRNEPVQACRSFRLALGALPKSTDLGEAERSLKRRLKLCQQNVARRHSN